MQLTINYAKDSLKVGLRFLTNHALVTITAFANGKECPLANLNFTVEKARRIQQRLVNHGYTTLATSTPAAPPLRRARRKCLKRP